ncbi:MULTISPECIES: hypothetical protein [unclassified Micromonospora]|uniref:hypothetical protein n=1 Tax=unclassified Micromonospora TaxID=2617518 RepID=UPI000EF43D0D|nr:MULTISPECIES: hypothetical protein [unclassified Micromonospora]RLP87339.1 hypothetical protein EAD89_19600 [Micromonospora sp. BL4]RLP95350.1 hypothetical protein EAD98_13690 [Micromonospora sp. CV4]
MRTFRLVVSALVVCAALSACGGTDGPATPTPSGSSPVTGQPTPPAATPSTGAPTTPTAPSSTPKPPTSPGGPTVPPPVGATELTGTITPGVEPNCVLLDGYLLIGGPRDVLRAGAKVTVTGRVEPGMMTTCQQGTPFVVEGAHRS